MALSSASEHAAPRRVQDGLIALAFVGAVAAIYWPTAGFEFVDYDDGIYVYDNAHLAKGLGAEGIWWAFTESAAFGNWDPLNWLSHLFAHELFGDDPGGHHLISPALHFCSTWLLFLVWRRMTGSAWGAFLLAGVFAAHPLNVETTAWVSERKGALSGFFWILGMLAYARFVERPDRARLGWVVAALIAGLLSKPILMTFPFALLLLDIWPLQRAPLPLNAADRKAFGARVMEKWPLFLVVAVWLPVAYAAQNQFGAVSHLDSAPLDLRLSNALVSYVRYIGHFFWPADLAAFYPYPESWPIGRVVASAVTLIGFSGFVARQAGRRPYLIVGWLWFLGTMIPVIQLVQIGSHSMADRHMYLSMQGLAVMAIWGGRDALRSWLPGGGRLPACLAGCAVVLGLGVAARLQTMHWRDSVALFERATSATRDNDYALVMLGKARLERGDTAGAEAALQRAVELKPNAADAWHFLGVAAYRKEDWAGARDRLDRSIRLNNEGGYLPYSMEFLARSQARSGDTAGALATWRRLCEIAPDLPAPRYELGLAEASIGRDQAAVEAFRASLDRDASAAHTWYAMGNALLRLRLTDDAVAAYRETLQRRPAHTGALVNLGTVRLNSGNLDEARDFYQRATEADPDLVLAQQNLGGVLERLGLPGQAAVRYRRVVALEPGSESGRLGLARALAASGDAAAAIAELRELAARFPGKAERFLDVARKLARDAGLTDGAAGLERELGK